MPDFLSIGRFAQITRLSIKALHLYEALGLLRPAYIDPHSGYRYFTITQLPLARRIRLLRQVDMPLGAIRTALEATTAEALNAVLLEQQLRIQERIEKDRQALRLLQGVMDHPAEDLNIDVHVKTLEAQMVAGIRFQSTPEEERKQLPALLGVLEHFTAEQHIRLPDAPPLRLSHDYSDHWVDTEIAVPVTRLVPPDGQIVTRRLPGSTVAYVRHVGPASELWAVYWAVLAWIQERGHQPGPVPSEVYLTARARSWSDGCRTEVRWPFLEATSEQEPAFETF